MSYTKFFLKNIDCLRDLYDLHMMEDPNPIIYHIYGGWVCFFSPCNRGLMAQSASCAVMEPGVLKKTLPRPIFSNPILANPNGISNFM